MPVWRASTMETFTVDEGMEPWPCEVRIDSPDIVVSYREVGGEHVVYRGQEVSPGHFELTCTSPVGTASLHRFADDDLRLVGEWREAGEQGLWRVELADEDRMEMASTDRRDRLDASDEAPASGA